MLDLSHFTITPDGLHYHGVDRYTISEDHRFSGYNITVDILDEDGCPAPDPCQSYCSPTLSAAVAIIEALERGEDV